MTAGEGKCMKANKINKQGALKTRLAPAYTEWVCQICKMLFFNLFWSLLSFIFCRDCIQSELFCLTEGTVLVHISATRRRVDGC